MSPRRDRPDRDIWSLQLQSQGTSEAVWASSGRSTQPLVVGPESPSTLQSSAPPTATPVPDPCPNSIPQQRGFMRSCGTLIFSYWVLLVKIDKPKRFPQPSEFTVFQETLTPTQGDEEAKAPSFGITHCSCIQRFSTLTPVSDLPLLHVERKTRSKKPKEW